MILTEMKRLELRRRENDEFKFLSGNFNFLANVFLGCPGILFATKMYLVLTGPTANITISILNQRGNACVIVS
jgi:hypothetical protein